MDFRQYLPSSHFSTIVGSIAIAGALVLLAKYVTSPSAPSAALTTATGEQTQNWQTAFDSVQADAPSLPPPPDSTAVDNLREAAKSSNITDTVARSLLVNLTAAGSQGLGSDIPTQEELVANAVSQINTEPAVVYSPSDLTQVAQTSTNLKTWGNAVMQTFLKHPKANNNDALVALGQAFDKANSKELAPLAEISSAYAALAKDLSDVPVPTTITPLYLKLINNLSTMALGVGEMQSVGKDPLRGLAGLQIFQSAGGEASRVLTTLAGELSKSGILFTKDEPGFSWSVFVSSYTQ